MSVPPNEPPRDPPPPPPTEPPPERVEVERKSSSPLVWLLLIIALLAIGWYFYSQRGPMETPVEPPTPIGETEIGDGTPPPPASETPAATPAPAPAAPATSVAEPLSRVEPSYPATALRAQEEGTVVLRVEVDAEGNPTSVEVEQSSRSRDLDRAARDAVRSWTFSPAMEDGQPVASTVTVPVDFRIDEQ